MQLSKYISTNGLGSLFAITVIGTIVSFAGPLTLGAIVDKVIPHKAASTLQVIVFVLICAGLFESVIVMIRGQIIAYKSAEMTAGYAQSLITTLFRLPNTDLLGEAGQTTTAQIISLNLYRNHINEFTTFLLQVGFTSVVFSIALSILNQSLFLTVLFGFVANFLIYFSIRPFVKSVVRESLTQYDRFVTGLQTNVQAIETLRAFGLSSRVSDTLQRSAEKAFRAGMNASKTTMIGAGTSKMISRLVETIVIFLGTAAVMRETMTLGELITFQMFAARLFEPLSRLPNAWEHYQRIAEYTSRWSDILDRETLKDKRGMTRFEVTDSSVLNVRKIGFHYQGRPPILEDFSLKIEAGEIVFVLGPSGSGKSTLVRLLTGLLVPQHGNIEVMGHELEDIGENIRKRYVSCALQEPVLLPGSIAENIAAFDQTITRSQIEEAAACANAMPFIQRLTESMDTMIGEHGIELSGGEKQRLCLARMLAADGSLMIMDEATTGLDRELEIKTLRAIISFCKPWQALMIITHREDLATLGTRCIRLDGGQIVSDRKTDDRHHMELV